MLMREQIEEMKIELRRLQMLLIECYKKTNDPVFEEKVRTEIQQQILRVQFVTGRSS